MEFDSKGTMVHTNLSAQSTGYLYNATYVPADTQWDREIFGKFPESITFQRSVIEDEKQVLANIDLVARSNNTNVQQVITTDTGYGSLNLPVGMQEP